MRRPIGAVAVAFAGAVALSGCSFGADAEGTYVPTSGEVAFYPQSSEGLDETVEGELVLADGCLTVKPTEGESVVPVFGGADATWDGATLTLGAETYAVGDDITLTGGPVDGGYLGPMTYIPSGCDRTAAFFVAPLAAG